MLHMKTIKNKKVIVLLALVFVFFIIGIVVKNKVFAYASGYGRAKVEYNANDNSSVFPDSYKQYIKNLKTIHPNWIIKAVYLNLDWNYSVEVQYNSTKSRVENGHYSDNWKNLDRQSESGYNAAGYVLASKKAIEYTMDPRNFLTDEGIFQFKRINESVELDELIAVEKSLNGTIMNKDEYKNKYYNGTSWVNMDKTYSQIIKNAGSSQNVSPLFIASRIRQETSGNILSIDSISGRHPNYPGYFNFFNIGATDGNGAVRNGLALAEYNGWNNPEKAINGGIDNIYRNYIKYGQDTVYFQKFDVNNCEQATGIYSHMQYMTNINAPVGESKFAYNGYLNSNTLEKPFIFYIPIYENMPDNISTHPDTEPTNVTGPDIIYLDDIKDKNVDDVFRIRSSPDDSNDNNIIKIIRETQEGAENRTKFTRIQVGTNGWDKIRLSDGTEGYVFQTFVKEYKYKHVTGITMNKNSLNLKTAESATLTTIISPSDAYIKIVNWSSNNSSIASVDSNGKVTANGIGTVEIIATTLDGDKIAKCIVTVGNTIAESISLASDEYPVIVGNHIQLNPTFTPLTTSNKNYDIVIENTSVASVENGKIKGLKVGSTKVTLSTKDGSNKSFTFTLKVNETVSTIKDLDVDTNNIITKVEPGKTASFIKGKIQTNYAKKVINNNKELKDTDLIGTGTKIQIFSENNLLEEYTIIILGDINGDGSIDSSDLLKIRRHMLNLENLSGCYFSAANIHKEDSLIDSSDLLRLKQHLLGLSTIVQ